jgi:hypothetical protein
MELGCEICIVVGGDISIKRVIRDHDYFGSDNGTRFFGTWSDMIHRTCHINIFTF